MSTQDIQQLIDFISQSGLDEVNIETTDLKISVKRYGTGVPTAASAPVAQAPAAPTTGCCRSGSTCCNTGSA